jgi:hypothetical protein
VTVSSRQHPRLRCWLLIATPALAACSFSAPSYEEYARERREVSGVADAADASPMSDAGRTDTGGNSEDAGPDACIDSMCAGLVCPTQQADCNQNPADGCETPLGSITDCTGCGVACTNEHGTTACSATDAGAACNPICASGFADCDLNPNNGCETNTNSDPNDCGRCGVACPANGGTPACREGQCGISACNAGFGDCKNTGVCSVDLNSDPKNCGACGHVCPAAHGTPTCNGGVCEITCDSGWGDCNRADTDAGLPPADGCETKLNVPDSNGNVHNCGACGADCERRSLTTVNLAQCALGICARDCMAGAADCDNNRDVPGCSGRTCGCEVLLADDPKNCGACGHVCASGKCAKDACE